VVFIPYVIVILV